MEGYQREAVGETTIFAGKIVIRAQKAVSENPFTNKDNECPCFFSSAVHQINHHPGDECCQLDQ